MANGVHLSQDEKTFGMLAHLSALAVFVLPSFGNIIGPLIVWLIKKDQSDWVDRQGKEALNFQISMSIYFIAGSILTTILMFTFIGIPLALVLVLALIPFSIFWLVVVIIAAVKANDGYAYDYPLTIRLIR